MKESGAGSWADSQLRDAFRDPGSFCLSAQPSILALVFRLVPHDSKMAAPPPASPPASFPGRENEDKRQRCVLTETDPF